MSTSTVTNIQPQVSTATQDIPRWAWWWMAVMGVMLVVFFWGGMVWFIRGGTGSMGPGAIDLFLGIFSSKWNPDWSHGLVLPAISIYYIYQKRHELAEKDKYVSWWGLGILLAAMFAYLLGIFPGEHYMFQSYALIMGLFGVTLLMLGPRMMSVLWFPVLYLSLGIRVADRIWDFIAWRLQLLASHASTVFLNLFGIDTEVTGSTIELFRNYESIGELNVAEACSGLRMLMAFIALGIAMAFLADRAWWQRAIIVLMTVPIALLVNIGRVTVIGLIYLKDPELATGDFHTFVGLLMLIPAGILFLLLGWALNQIIITEGDGAGAHSIPKSPYPTQDAYLAPANSRSPLNVMYGVFVGAIITALLGLGYWSSLGLLRDDVLPFGLGLAGAIGGIVIAATGAVVLLRYCIKSWGAKPQVGDGRVLGMVIGILLIGAIGTSSVLKATRAVLYKEPVPLRHFLSAIPSELYGWERVVLEPPLPKEIEDKLGTKDYISAVYRSTENSNEQVRLHIAYYTGTPDKVPHIPDRCYLASGAEGLKNSVVSLALEREDYTPSGDEGGVEADSVLADDRVYLPATDFGATAFTFSPANAPNTTSNVVYFFAINGKYTSTAEATRLASFDFSNKYAYYAKVEMLIPGVADTEEAGRIAEGFLADMLPEVMAALPDWRLIESGEYQPEKDDLAQ